MVEVQTQIWPGRPKTINFHFLDHQDLLVIFGHVYSKFETQEYLKTIYKTLKLFNFICKNIKFSKTQNMTVFEKTRAGK